MKGSTTPGITSSERSIRLRSTLGGRCQGSRGGQHRDKKENGSLLDPLFYPVLAPSDGAVSVVVVVSVVPVSVPPLADQKEGDDRTEEREPADDTADDRTEWPTRRNKHGQSPKTKVRSRDRTDPIDEDEDVVARLVRPDCTATLDVNVADTLTIC